MLSKFGRKFFAEPLASLAPKLRDMGFTPNGLTFLGFILSGFAAFILANGFFLWGGFLLWGASMFDMLDGALARVTEQSSKFGAFLDSTLDRYSESVVLLALTYFYTTQTEAQIEPVLIFATLIGSLMVSYTRARAEALEIECKAGLLQRPERLFILITGLILGWMLPTLWILAILTNVTALQRIYEVYWRTRQQAQQNQTGKKIIKPNDNWPVQG